jgi:hypothetical protein
VIKTTILHALNKREKKSKVEKNISKSSSYDVTVLGGEGLAICDALLNFREVPKEKT